MITENTATSLDVARTMLRSDDFVDAPSVSAHLNSARVAHPLLKRLGWTRKSRMITSGRFTGCTEHRWISPDGQTCWETDEALTIALTALALTDSQETPA